MKTSFKLSGDRQFVANVQNLKTGTARQVAQSMNTNVGEVDLTEMKRRCPVWNPARKVPRGHAPGQLRATGRFEAATPRKLQLTWAFGDRDVDYAGYVHEDLEAFHAIGEARYMASVIEESEPYVLNRTAAGIDLRRAMRGS